MDNRVKVDGKIDEADLRARLQNLIDDPQVRTEANRALAETVDPWVPYDTGALSKNITINANGVTYNQPYAAKNYYGDDIRHKTNKHPLATAHWDDVAMQTEMDSLTAKIKDILLKKANGQNG